MSSFETPVRYIKDHYEPDDRLCVALIKRGEQARIKQEFADARAICSPKYQAHLRAENANGSDVYLSVNTIVPGARNRTKSDIDQIRHLFCDVDERGPEVVKAIFASELPKPSAVIESSRDRFQVLWKVGGFSKDQAEMAVRHIATRFGADEAVWDCARVLRVPGFRNTKRETPFYARIVQDDRAGRILTPQDFPAFPPLERTVQHLSKTSAPAGHSQSEKDWGQVMTALERGISPAEIKARIEAERTGNKSQPHRYAEYTVEKALKIFEQKRKGLAPQRVAKESLMTERQNLKPPAQLTDEQIAAESRDLHSRHARLLERYEKAPAVERAEIRQAIEPLVNRERELRREYAGRTNRKLSRDQVPSQQLGYAR